MPITINARRKVIHLTALSLLFTFTGSCGGGGVPEDPTPPPGVEQPPVVEPLMADAGRDLSALNSTVVQLDGSASLGQGSDAVSFSWRQLSGPAVQFLSDDEAHSARPRMIIPSVLTPTDLELELTVSQDGQSASDSVTIRVEPCAPPNGLSDNPALENGLVYGDCISPGFGPFTAYESNAERGEIFHFEGFGDYHVQWQELALGGERGQVVEVTWKANGAEQTSTTNGWFGIGTMLQGAGVDLSEFAQGTLQFDMRVVYHETPNNPTPFIAKMECGWPCASAEMPIPGVESSYEWQTYSYSVASLINSGLDISNVTYALVIQPLWRQQEQGVTVQVDNVQLLSEYTPPPPMDGCPKAGNVSYTLARSANPTADEQDAYNRITQAMDEAVKQYNCYTNLERVLRVSYNPGVATADGNPNGSIRFGSRASMHHVTAMHEISHVFGVGAGPFRNLVQNGVYTGAAGNAQLRAISGIADDQLRSDGTHFWPHGLNYIHEGETQQDLINHCLVVEAIVADLQ